METDVVQVVIARELELQPSETRRTPSDVDRLLDPESREVGASGRLWTRAETVQQLACGTGEDPPIHVSEMHGRVLSPTLVLRTYRSERAGRHSRRSSLWRDSDGRWRVLYHQGTPTSNG
jgi:hypothetical protein